MTIRQQRTRRTPGDEAHRPAEVLAATARRSSGRRTRADAAPTQARYQQHQPRPFNEPAHRAMAMYEPLPEPVPLSEQPQYGEYVSYQSFAARSNPPVEIIHPSPELAVARARLRDPSQAASGARTPAASPSPVIARSEPGHPPLPELSPTHYQRVALAAPPEPLPALTPVPTIAASPRRGERQRDDVRRALAPIPAQTAIPPAQGWIASPATAMAW